MVSSLLTVLATALVLPAVTHAAPTADPCEKIGGQFFMPPADALACLKVFPFNETLRQNVLTVVERVFNFYTFEDFYLNSPAPFQESTTNIRAELQRINSTTYETDYDFNRDLFDFTNQLNDGHTRWFPNCFTTFQNLLPAPLVVLADAHGVQSVFVAPDSVEFVSLLGDEFTSFFDGIGFDWQRLAGARVLEIEGKDAFDYVDDVARTRSGNFIDHGVRVNSVFSSYRLSGNDFSQRFGDAAGPVFPDQESLTMKLVTVNSTTAETVTVPFLASYIGLEEFFDTVSYRVANCEITGATNGIDRKKTNLVSQALPPRQQRMRGSIVDLSAKKSVGLPSQFHPTLPPVGGSEGVVKSFILPDNKTGVMFVGSFEPDDFVGFQTDVQSATAQFKAAGVTQLLVDLTDNGGGFVCLGAFLHQFLAGSRNLGNPGFQSVLRANPLARKIIQSDIKLGVDNTLAFYPADNFAFINNNTEMPATHDYATPDVTVTINGQRFEESQRFFDVCTPFNIDMPVDPPFDLEKVAIVGNGNCASTCALFTTLMHERHNTKMAVFGGKPGEPVEFKGMAGNQVLEFADIDSEIKTADLKNDPLAPPDLLVNGNFRHNWRIAFSFFDEKTPIEYVSEPAQFRFPYTIDTYNNPQNLWVFAASELFK